MSRTGFSLSGLDFDLDFGFNFKERKEKSTQAEACATKSRVTTRFDIRTLNGK
jgi:hypothetical protein